MRILICNDDGIHAVGIQTLAKRLAKEHEVVVVAPHVEQSGVSYSLSYRLPLHMREVKIPGFEGRAYDINGFPADCTKVGMKRIPDFFPDLVVTGINHGPNLGVDVYPSGTVNSAISAVLEGVPAIATSLADFFSQDFEAAAEYAARLVNYVEQHPIPKGMLLNLNVPALPLEEIKGFKLAPLNMEHFKLWYTDFEAPLQRKLIWLDCELERTYSNTVYDDDDCVKEGYACVTPLKVDTTCYEYMKEMEKTGFFVK